MLRGNLACALLTAFEQIASVLRDIVENFGDVQGRGGDIATLLKNCIVGFICVRPFDERSPIKVEFSQKADLILR